MSNFLRKLWHDRKHWFDVFCFIAIGFFYLITWFPYFGVKKIPEELWKIVTPLAKDTISSGITASSILLPSTIAIMAIMKKNNTITAHLKDSFYSLYLATWFFIISLSAAIFNFTHLPIRLRAEMHISFDWVIGFLVITQFLFLFIGIVKLCRGSYYLRQDILNR